MRKSIERIIDEMKSKLNGYVVLMFYHFTNYCVKAEPMALLSLTIEDEEGEEKDFEEVAYASQPNDYQFEIIPQEPGLLFNICKSILEAHPDFTQEVITASEENRIDDDNKEEQHVICTMPVVNDDRHDLLMDGVKLQYDACKLKLETTYDAYKVKLTSMMLGDKPEDVEEAEGELENMYNEYVKMADEYKANKEKEIEDAYQKWLAEQKEKADKEAEQAAARGEGMGFGLRMNREEIEEDEE
mgnify:CR=1 FL=1